MDEFLLNVAVPEGQELTAGEINNIVYLCCKYTVGWPMRQADLAVCDMMARQEGKIAGAKGVSKLVETTCEYVWDHICGEPEEPTPEQLCEHMRPAIEEWFGKTTQEERSRID